MMEFVRLATIQDFSRKKIHSYSLLGRRIAIIKKDDGNFHAIEAFCKHQGADLTRGEVVGYVATCPRHQWKYNLLTGECLTHDSAPLRRFGIRVEGDDVLVSLSPLDEQ